MNLSFAGKNGFEFIVKPKLKNLTDHSFSVFTNTKPLVSVKNREKTKNPIVVIGESSEFIVIWAHRKKISNV